MRMQPEDTWVPMVHGSNEPWTIGTQVSSGCIRMRNEDTWVPMVQGSFEPWMRYMVEPRYKARAPSGLSGPPTMWCGRSGRRLSISSGGVQSGHSRLLVTWCVPDQV